MTATISHPRILIVSESCNLSQVLIESLNKLDCDISIYSKNKARWQGRYNLINSDEVVTSHHDYVIVIDLDTNVFKYSSILGKLLAVNSHKKIILVVPFSQTPHKARLTNSFLESHQNHRLKTIFLGIVVNDSPPYFDKTLFENNLFRLPNREQEIRFADIKGSANFIIKNTFSFSSKDPAAYISKPFTISELIGQDEIGNTLSVVHQRELTPSVKEIVDSEISLDRLSNIVNTSIRSIEVKDKNSALVETKKTHTVRINKRSLRQPTFLFRVLTLMVVVFVILPAIIFNIAAASTKYNVRHKGITNIKYLAAGRVVSRLNTRILSLYGNLPILEDVVHDFYRGSLLFDSINTIYENDSKMTDLTTNLMSSILSKSAKDPEEIINSLQSELDYKYASLEYLKGDIGVIANDYGLTHEDMDHLLSVDSTKIINTKDFLSNAINLMGDKSQKNYFLVVQDEDKLNPSGGEILVSALISFDKGRLSNFVVYGNEEIDQNTKGNRNLPKILGDRGVVPSFANANNNVFTQDNVKDILWYVDSALDTKPDGVMFVNKETLESISQLDESEVYTTNSVADGRVLLEKTLESLMGDSFEIRKMLSILSKALNNKDVHVWFTDSITQGQFDKLNYSNNAISHSCTDCNGQMLYVVETNLSDNNYQDKLNRKAELEVFFQEKVAKSTLRFSYDLPQELLQDVYFQILLPKDASIAPIKLTDNNATTLIKPDVYATNNYKVAGVTIKLAKETVVEINWEHAYKILEIGDKYLLKWLKQPGKDNYPVVLSVNGKLIGDLTADANDGYNTDSSSDIEIEI